MPSATATASSAISEAQGLDPQAFLGFLAQLKDLTPANGFNMVLTVNEDNHRLRNDLKSQEEQIMALQNEFKEANSQKEITIKQMLKMNEEERRCHGDTKIQVQELKKFLQGKEDCIKGKDAALETKQAQLDQAKSDFTKQTATLVQAQKDAAEFQAELKAKYFMIDQLKTEKSRLNGILSTVKDKAKELEGTTLKLQKSLNETRVKLSTIESFSAGHIESDEGSLIDDFTAFWQFAKIELHSQLRADFSAEAIANTAAWTNLKRCELVHFHQIPIPFSNTQPAKQIRLAIILAVLAREIDRYIFQPCYIIPEDTRIRKVLVDLAVADSEKESFCRSVLQSVNTQDQKKALLAIIQMVVNRVLLYFEDLLTEAQRASMRSTLEKIVRKAAAIWEPIRRAKRRYESDFEQPGPDEYWLPFTIAENDRPEAQIARHAQEENALTIFPRLSVIEKGTMTWYKMTLRRVNAGWEDVWDAMGHPRAWSRPWW